MTGLQTVATMGENEAGYQPIAAGVTPGRQGLLELLGERGAQVCIGGWGRIWETCACFTLARMPTSELAL